MLIPPSRRDREKVIDWVTLNITPVEIMLLSTQYWVINAKLNEGLEEVMVIYEHPLPRVEDGLPGLKAWSPVAL